MKIEGEGEMRRDAEINIGRSPHEPLLVEGQCDVFL
jgi:hypothetical protein